MKDKIKIPGIKEVAKALGLKYDGPKQENLLSSVAMDGKGGCQISIAYEGGSYRSFEKVAIVVQTSNYGRDKVRRKVYVHKGHHFYEHTVVAARPLTADEVAKLEKKYAEVVKAQREVNRVNKARERDYDAKRNARETLKEALKKAGIDEYGDDDVPYLSIYTDTPKIVISLSLTNPEQAVAIYKAVKAALQKRR